MPVRKIHVEKEKGGQCEPRFKLLNPRNFGNGRLRILPILKLTAKHIKDFITLVGQI
jgi:hypothetical protein